MEWLLLPQMQRRREVEGTEDIKYHLGESKVKEHGQSVARYKHIPNLSIPPAEWKAKSTQDADWPLYCTEKKTPGEQWMCKTGPSTVRIKCSSYPTRRITRCSLMHHLCWIPHYSKNNAVQIRLPRWTMAEVHHGLSCGVSNDVSLLKKTTKQARQQRDK